MHRYPIISTMLMFVLISITLCHVVVAVPVVTFTSSGAKINDPSNNYETPLYSVTVVARIQPQQAYLEWTLPQSFSSQHNIICKVADNSGATLGNCNADGSHDVQSSSALSIAQFIITYDTSYRFGIKFSLSFTRGTIAAMYDFPGISPITFSTIPNINLSPVYVSGATRWQPFITNAMQEFPSYTVPEDTTPLFICLKTGSCCKVQPQSFQCSAGWDTDLTALSNSEGEFSVHTTQQSGSDSFDVIEVPTVRLSLPVPTTDPAAHTSGWPFVIGKSYDPISTETPTPGESYIQRVAGTDNTIEVRWSFWKTTTWHSNLPATKQNLQFHFPNYPIYTLFSSHLGCKCGGNFGSIIQCKPDAQISWEVTDIICTFNVARAAEGHIGVVFEPDNVLSGASDPFAIAISYQSSPAATIRTFMSKSPITTQHWNLVLKSLRWDVVVERSPGATQYIGAMQDEVTQEWYVQERFYLTFHGVSAAQPIYLSQLDDNAIPDLFACDAGGGVMGTKHTSAYVGTPNLGQTVWNSYSCVYYRHINAAPLYTTPGNTPTYTSSQANFKWYRTNTINGPEAKVLNNYDRTEASYSPVDLRLLKPKFQPSPVSSPPTKLEFRTFALQTWSSSFRIVMASPFNGQSISDDLSVWKDPQTSFPVGLIILTSLISNTDTYRLDASVPSTTTNFALISTPSTNSQEFKYKTGAITQGPFEMDYVLNPVPSSDNTQPLQFAANHIVSSNINHNYPPYFLTDTIWVFKPNIPANNRFIQLESKSKNVYIPVNLIGRTDGSGEPIIFENGIEFSFIACGLVNDALFVDNNVVNVIINAVTFSGRATVELINFNAGLKDLCQGIIVETHSTSTQKLYSNELYDLRVILTPAGTPSTTSYYSRAFKPMQPPSYVNQIDSLTATMSDVNLFVRPNASPLNIASFPTILTINAKLAHTPINGIDVGSESLMIEGDFPSWVILDSSLSSTCLISSFPPGNHPAHRTIEVPIKPIAGAIKPSFRNYVDHNDPLIPFPDVVQLGETCTITCTLRLAPNLAIPVNDINTPVQMKNIALTILPYQTATQIPSKSTGPLGYYFLHPSNTVFCPGCVIDDVPITTVVKDVLPAPTPKLPQITTSLTTGHCEVIMTNKATMQMYDAQTHSRMCSIPMAGMLTTRAVTQADVGNNIVLPTDKPEYNLCDCRCKGYWVDDSNNNDYKKCSKCEVPDCPTLFTPNSECTACECSTPQCKRFTTNVFGMIYFKPQVLRYLVDLKTDSTTAQFNDVTLGQDALSTYLYNPIQSYRSTYFEIMSKFTIYLNEKLTSAVNSAPEPSVLQSVLITPLVEGSFTTWKITLNLVNVSKRPLSQIAPLYGLPAIEQKMSELFNTFITTQFSLTSSTTSTTFPSFVSTAPVSTQSPTQLPLFTSDVIKVGCVNRAAYDNTSVTPIKADMLHECPLPNQYVAVKNNLTKADSLNPLWSKCDTDNTISFINYESLLSPTVTTTALKVRQLYPYCFDFAGVNVGLEFNIPCGYNPSTDLLYTTTTSTLMLPSYATAVLGSFVLSSDTDKVIQDRIAALRSFPSPRFPSFPITTVVLCPTVDSSSTPSITPTKRCSVDTYGDECQFKSIIAETSMTSSPTTVSPQSYAHVQWDFMGDNTQELTIVLYSTQKKNDGQGYFVWSQLLTTVPVASLYASAQVPTLDQSKLFEMVYDAIANGNNIDLVNIYSSSTNIAIKGYFTRGAQQLINLDQQQIVEQFTFDLPMLCTEFNVSCSHGSSQYCTQNDGRCKCKHGYYDVNPTQERSSSYIIDPNDSSKNIDGNDLTCLPLCQNDGEWDNETSTCKCQDGYNGEYCQVKDDCQVNKSSLCQGDNGYIAFTLLTDDDSEATTTTTTPSCQDTKCQCYGHWINQSDAPNTDDLIKKKPKDYVTRNNGCSICSLKPINSQFYSPEQLVIINDYYSSNTELSTQYFGNEDTMYTQTYQPTTTTTTITTNINTNEQLHPLTQQRCYITGTQPITYDDGNCIKCQCKRGYGGEYCQLHIAYANMTYTPIDGNDYIYDKTTEVLLFNKLAEELSLSMNNFDQTQMFVIQHNRDYHWVEIGLYTGLDFFIRNGEYNASIQQQQQQQEQEQQEQSKGYLMSTQQTTTTTAIPTGFNPTLLPTNLDSLYTQWDDLTTNFPTIPVKNQDTNDYLGPIDPPTIIQDPACFEQEIIGCSGIDERPKRASGHALLIGLVVGLVTAAILFIILVLILLWCKKNQRGFWKSQKEQERDELSNFVPTKTNTFKGSTAAPSMTVGTSSMVPLGSTTGGVEMQSQQTTTTSAVQSASNHTEVKDPTLPPNYKAYKDAKGQVFYVDDQTMTTSWDHPNKVKDKDGEGGGDYGAGW